MKHVNNPTEYLHGILRNGEAYYRLRTKELTDLGETKSECQRTVE